jgi:serine/threonine-protein kinase
MGRVYRASDRQLGREVAIKTLTEGFVGDAEMLERFYIEAAKTGMLKHPNIVTVYDLGEQDGHPYIVMEYVTGDALDKVIQSNRSLNVATKLSIVEQVCHALAYAHRNGVVHRDVKPANVILQPDGVVKLLDFGIACQEKREHGLTQTGSVIGTVHYMAPERLQCKEFDGRSDIFSTGVMLYQLLSGHLPFGGEDCVAIHKLLNEPYPPLNHYLDGYPDELDVILSRSMAKAPVDRYATADEMASEIATVAEQLKKEQVIEMFQQAERLVGNDEYTRAREVLLKVAKLDAKHVGARQLMVQVQQNLAQRERAAQIQQLRTQAEDAKLEKRFADAIGHLEQALKLDPSSSELIVALEALRQQKTRHEQVEGCLRRVEDARSRQDFARAQAEIAKALELDKDDSRVRATYASLVRQVEETARLAKSRKLLESARNEVVARHFTAAIKLLTEAEQLDPSNPELIALYQSAKSGQGQEQRRRVIESLQNEIAIAVTREEVAHALSMVKEALVKLPNDPSLLQFKAQLEKQTDEHDVRRMVDETVQKCRGLLESSPREALQIVQEKLKMFPGNDRLLVLHTSIEHHLQRQAADEARIRYLTLANEALNKRKYREAVRLLESCQAEGVFSDEMRGLLDFARHEASREQRESLAEESLGQAQSLMSQGAYEETIKLLDPLVTQNGDPALKNILEKARAQQRALQNSLDSIAKAVPQFLKEEQFDEGVAFLKSQPAAVLQHPAAKKALTSLRTLREQSRRELQAIGLAYAALDSQELVAGWNSLQNALQAHPDSVLLSRIVQTFDPRRRQQADHMVRVAIERAQEALSAGDADVAQETLNAAVGMMECTSPEVKSTWQNLAREVARSNVLSRIGLKRPRAV